MRIRIIDAFADRPFAGNPAAVCTLDGETWPDAAWMQRVAGELRAPMTAFVLPGDEGRFGLRWFTPRIEERLCGHATLAAAFAVGGDDLRFDTLSGELRASVARDGAVTLDFPRATVAPRAPLEGLAAALGAEPVELYESAAPHDVLAVLADEATVAALAPRLDAIAAIQRREAVRLVCVTAQAPAGSPHDITSRVFSPADGIDEDPVTGSAHCALAPLWAPRLGERLVCRQCSARGGVVHTQLAGDRVLLTGHARLVADGELTA